MGRLIDADELEYMQIGTNAYVRAEDIFSATPVDAVPVVRCNECQYFRTHDKNVGFCMKSHCLKRINGYCDDAERKDGDNHEG